MTVKKTIFPFVALGVSAAFSLNANAHDFTAENGGTTIFYNITSPSSVEVTYDGSGTSLYNSYFGNVSVPASVQHDGSTYNVTAVGARAFAYSDELTEVNLPASVLSIGQRAFLCTAIEAISLPAALENIGDFAFAWCDNLTSVSIPASVSSVSYNAFDQCMRLTAINVASGNASYSSAGGILLDKAGSEIVIYPAGISEPYSVPLQIKEIGNGAFYGCCFLPAVTLPQDLVSIGENAFSFCNNLKTVHIPAHVTEIGQNAFADCFSLVDINVDESNPSFKSVDGVLLDKDGKILIQSPGGLNGDALIPDGVTSIGDNAFFRSYGLAGVRFPESVVEIGKASFIDCPSLASVVIPADVKSIGDYAFALCSGLQNVFCFVTDPDDIITGADIFANVPLEHSTLFVPNDAVSLYESSDAWRSFSLIQGVGDLQEQEIVWTQNAKPFINDHLTLDAVASSGLPVTYTVSELSEAYASISGDKIVFVDPGNLVITATQAGNNQYLPAAPVSKVILVKGADAIDDITADESNIRVYGVDGTIVIDGAPDNAVASVYTVNGMQQYTGKRRSIPVEKGRIYIVHVGSRAFKVAVQ